MEDIAKPLRYAVLCLRFRGMSLIFADQKDTNVTQTYDASVITNEVSAMDTMTFCTMLLTQKILRTKTSMSSECRRVTSGLNLLYLYSQSSETSAKRVTPWTMSRGSACLSACAR